MSLYNDTEISSFVYTLLRTNLYKHSSIHIITVHPTKCVGGPVLFCSLVSVVVCNTPRQTCKQLQSRRLGNDVKPPLI